MAKTEQIEDNSLQGHHTEPQETLQQLARSCWQEKLPSAAAKETSASLSALLNSCSISLAVENMNGDQVEGVPVPSAAHDEVASFPPLSEFLPLGNPWDLLEPEKPNPIKAERHRQENEARLREEYRFIGPVLPHPVIVGEEYSLPKKTP